MTGRITSHIAPSANVDGVPYCELLRLERSRNARMEGKMREALEKWQEADEKPPNSSLRRILMNEARILTRKALQ